MQNSKIIDRRRFLKQSAQAGVGLAGASLLGPDWLAGREIPPSERITVACIGVGWQGTENMLSFLRQSDVQIVAVCDVDQEHLAEAKNTIDDYYGDKGCETTTEFREIIERKDIDVVSLGLPDHWHAIPAIEAARAGKDIFGEKPLSHTFAEGVAMVNAVNRYGRIWQTGSWQRSLNNFRFGAELVLNGRIN